MKYVIVIPDGCADEAQESLGGQTPLQRANISAMDQIARDGIVGLSSNVPEGFTPGSAVANMSLFGHDPHKYFTGRAPIEAAAQGIELGPNDWAVRCNLVTIIDQVMQSFTAGQISDEDARSLLKTAQEQIGVDAVEFVPGVSYRNLVIVRNQQIANSFSSESRATPPHDLTDKSVEDDFPRGPGSDLLSAWIEASFAWFADHPVNRARMQRGELPATNIWLWGIGKTPNLVPFKEKHGLQGAMISAVDLLKGLGKLIGWNVINVPGATGYLDTDYHAKGAACIKALAEHDIVCVHVEATDEASHEGKVDEKIKALESIDEKIVKPVHEFLKNNGAYRILVTPDHPTFLRTKTHSHGRVPFAMCGYGISADSYQSYDEVEAAKSELTIDQGWLLMDRFVLSR